MENIIPCVVALGVVVVTDYFHTRGDSYVSSAVPVFAFQLLVMLNTLIMKRNGGKGIIKLMMEKVWGTEE